jgi:hypothetical protein
VILEGLDFVCFDQSQNHDLIKIVGSPKSHRVQTLECSSAAAEASLVATLNPEVSLVATL